jgi:hypothetical protein
LNLVRKGTEFVAFSTLVLMWNPVKKNLIHYFLLTVFGDDVLRGEGVVLDVVDVVSVRLVILLGVGDEVGSGGTWASPCSCSPFCPFLRLLAAFSALRRTSLSFLDSFLPSDSDTLNVPEEAGFLLDAGVVRDGILDAETESEVESVSSIRLEDTLDIILYFDASL